MEDDGNGKMGEKDWFKFSVLGRVRLLVLYLIGYTLIATLIDRQLRVETYLNRQLRHGL